MTTAVIAEFGEDEMKSKSFREIHGGLQRKDTGREREKAVIEDADKTESAD